MEARFRSDVSIVEPTSEQLSSPSRFPFSPTNFAMAVLSVLNFRRIAKSEWRKTISSALAGAMTWPAFRGAVSGFRQLAVRTDTGCACMHQNSPSLVGRHGRIVLGFDKLPLPAEALDITPRDALSKRSASRWSIRPHLRLEDCSNAALHCNLCQSDFVLVLAKRFRGCVALPPAAAFAVVSVMVLPVRACAASADTQGNWRHMAEHDSARSLRFHRSFPARRLLSPAASRKRLSA